MLLDHAQWYDTVMGDVEADTCHSTKSMLWSDVIDKKQKNKNVVDSSDCGIPRTPREFATRGSNEAWQIF